MLLHHTWAAIQLILCTEHGSAAAASIYPVTVMYTYAHTMTIANTTLLKHMLTPLASAFHTQQCNAHWLCELVPERLLFMIKMAQNAVQ